MLRRQDCDNRVYNYHNAGLTLVELIIAVFVLGMIVMIAAPKFQNFIATYEVKEAAKELAGDLQYIQQRSMNAADLNAPILLFNNSVPYGYFITQNTVAIKPQVKFPAGVSLGANSGTVSFNLSGKPNVAGSVAVQNVAKGIYLYVVWDIEGRIRVGASP